MLYLPSQRFIEYCTQRGWEPQLGYKDNLSPKNPQDGRPLEPLPQHLFDDHHFLELSFYPISDQERLVHAFWDCLGETTFKPSGQLLISIYCSSVRPVVHDDIAQLVDLDVEKVAFGFPHKIFDRWDVVVHEPGDTGAHREPEYSGRFMLNRDRLATVGLYSRGEAEFANGWGYPCTDTILASPSMHNAGSFLADGIDINHTNSRTRDYRNIRIGHRTIGCLNDLLHAFSVITKYFHEGVYDHTNEDMYDFGDATDSAVIVSEAITGKKSKQRIRSPTFDVSKETH